MSAKNAKSKALRKKIKRDKRYQSIKEVLEDESYKIRFNVLSNELKVNHSSRTSNKLSASDPNFGKKLFEASVIEMSVRARAVEIKVLCNSVAQYLTRTLKYFKDYVFLEYADDLKIFSTVKERTMFVERLLKPMHEHLDKVEALLSTVDLYISDIDKASYAIKNIVSTFEVIRRNEGVVNV